MVIVYYGGLGDNGAALTSIILLLTHASAVTELYDPVTASRLFQVMGGQDYGQAAQPTGLPPTSTGSVNHTTKDCLLSVAGQTLSEGEINRESNCAFVEMGNVR